MKKIALCCNLFAQNVERLTQKEYDIVTFPLFLLNINQISKELKLLLSYYLNREPTRLNIYIHDEMKTPEILFLKEITDVIISILTTYECKMRVYNLSSKAPFPKVIYERDFRPNEIVEVKANIEQAA